MPNAQHTSNDAIRRIRRNGAASYLIALLIGLSLVLWVFPRWALTGGMPPGAPPAPDFGKDVLGQVYFFAQDWSSGGPGTFLVDRKLNMPWGANIGLTDSIPLLTVLAKVLRPVLPPFDQVVSLYQAAAWTLQPIAAVFALRSAGERRWLPAVGIAVMAASMPTFLHRLWHAALGGHFLLLTMLGLYLRIVRGGRFALACACVLQVALLLIHPYLMLMATALLLAAPLTLALRRDARWRVTLAAIAASSGTMLLLGQILGYWGSGSDGGYGFYSMNLAAPFWPSLSWLFPTWKFSDLDATGGQADGYQYLGLGMLVLLASSALKWRVWRALVRRHRGLALACLGLTALAVTNWMFLVHARLHLPFPSALLSQVRASGRCFWPVAYTLLVTSVLVTMRTLPRVGSGIVLGCALVQFADAQVLRVSDHAMLTFPAPYEFDQIRFTTVLRGHDRLTLLPTFPCNGGGTPANVDPLWLAGRMGMATNSMYMARETHVSSCLPAETTNVRPTPNEVRVVLPRAEQSVIDLPQHDRDCRVLKPYVLCTLDAAALVGLPPYAAPRVPMGVPMPVRAGGPGAALLMAGWTVPALGVGAWSTATSVFLGAAVDPAPTGSVRLSIRARSMPPRPWVGGSRRPRTVSVWAGTRHLADWSLSASLSGYEAVVPGDWIRQKGAVIVELRTGPLTSALDLGRTTDPRRFGIWLDSVTLALD